MRKAEILLIRSHKFRSCEMGQILKISRTEIAPSSSKMRHRMRSQVKGKQSLLTPPISKVLALAEFLKVSEKPLIQMVMLQGAMLSVIPNQGTFRAFLKNKCGKGENDTTHTQKNKLKGQWGTSMSLNSRMIPICFVVTFKARFYSALVTTRTCGTFVSGTG